MLMNFLVQIDIISMGFSIINLKGSHVKISKVCCNVLIHLSLDCLPKYSFACLEYTND